MTQDAKLSSQETRIMATKAAAMKAALDNTYINYRELGGIIECFAGSGIMNATLGHLMIANHEAKEPFFSAMVVSSDNGLPSAGFFDMAKIAGYPISSASPHDQKYNFWREQVKACKRHVLERIAAQSKKA